MNDVVTAAPRIRRVLVTGFGPFPGAPVNPTLAMLDLLEAEGVEGARLAFARLPVTFDGVGPALREAAARCEPDAILLLGLATSRSILHVETLARNRAGTVTPDVDGRVPQGASLVEGAAASHEASWRAESVLAALERAGHEATLSRDAGDYVCNAALFHALDGRLAPTVGFLHVPPVHVASHAASHAASPSVERLTHAARIVIGAMIGAGASPTRRRPSPAAEQPSPGRRR